MHPAADGQRVADGLAGVQIEAGAGVAGGVGYAALFALAAAAIGERRGIVVRALTAVGKRSLSSYLLQSVLLVPALYLQQVLRLPATAAA